MFPHLRTPLRRPDAMDMGDTFRPIHPREEEVGR